MRRLIFIFTLFALAVSMAHVSAQSSFVAQKMIKSFETGNADLLSSVMSDNIELVIPQTENFFTKQQAKGIVSNFFRRNPVVDFNVLHKGSKENASFIIGTLVSTRGSYRVSAFIRKTGGDFFVYQLRIEDPNE